MKLSEGKKILLLGLILLIIAGIIVVALKGFNVSLMFQKHESINLLIGKEIELKDIREICKEVFKDKNVVIRKIELFNDSVNINVESITNEEKEALANKINEKYQTEYTADSITVNSNSNIRIRDIIRPYLKPVIISVITIIVYMIIRFRKMNAFTLIGKIFGIVILTEASLVSMIAILRIPLSPIIINLLTVIAVIELLVYINKTEKEYRN